MSRTRRAAGSARIHRPGRATTRTASRRARARPPRRFARRTLRTTLDDLFLHAQRGIDRLVRRLRLGAPPEAGRRRLLIVQIDGLSRVVLGAARAIAWRIPTAAPSRSERDRAIVTRDLAALMAMPSAGDLVVYGIDAPEGHVSYIDEVGAHAGPSHAELHTFLVAPSDARLPVRIDHPTQLYDVFIRYQSPAPKTALPA